MYKLNLFLIKKIKGYIGILNKNVGLFLILSNEDGK